MALAGPHGVSGGTASLVYGLVTSGPGVYSWPFWGLTDARVSAKEDVAGVPCWRIDARHEDNTNLTLWLGRDDSLLHRLDQVSNFENFRSSSSITWNPRLNPDPATLEFPPVPER